MGKVWSKVWLVEGEGLSSMEPKWGWNVPAAKDVRPLISHEGWA